MKECKVCFNEKKTSVVEAQWMIRYEERTAKTLPPALLVLVFDVKTGGCWQKQKR